MKEDRLWMVLVVIISAVGLVIALALVQKYHESAETSEIPTLDAERERNMQQMKDSIARMERDMNSIQLSVFRIRLSLLEQKFEDCGCYDGTVNGRFDDEGLPSWTTPNEEE